MYKRQIHISNNNFEETQIGPIIAIGLITFLYMILPVSYLVHRKLKQQSESNSKNENEEKEQ